LAWRHESINLHPGVIAGTTNQFCLMRTCSV